MQRASAFPTLIKGVRALSAVAAEAQAVEPISQLSRQAIDRENKFGAFNYSPLEVVLSRGHGVHVYDVDGKHYFDFLSAYSAVNQGHGHPRIIEALTKQAKRLALTSRAFYNDVLGQYEERMCSLFGFDRLLPMNTGVEAVETAIKLSRRWGYMHKNIPAGQARIIFAKNNFHGRSVAAISASTDPLSYTGYEPLVPGFTTVPFDDLASLEQELKDPNVCAFIVEPIQGEAGVIVPSDTYLRGVAALCRKHNVLFVADEVQTGLARTGKLLACDHEGVKPDMLVLGKALSGGVYPVSAVLASNEVMLTLTPGTHGSTYGGNPIAAAVGMAAIDVILDEHLADNAERMGQLFRSTLKDLNSAAIKDVRGKGLLNAVQITPTEGNDASAVCNRMMENGLLAKPTHNNTIRFAPPLTINEAQMRECLDIIKHALHPTQ